MPSKEELGKNRERILTLLRSIKREGMENVIEHLEKNDFFEMPSSLKRHHNWEGGLAQHCLGVYERLSKTGEIFPKIAKSSHHFFMIYVKREKFIKIVMGSGKNTMIKI